MHVTVSVVIPARGRPELVRRAVDSALNQTLKPLEVIVVDDGSEPPLAGELDLPADAPISVIRHAPGVNAAFARNRGIEQASGDLVAFLDSDDWWARTHLEGAIELLEEMNGAGVFGAYRAHYGPGIEETHAGPGDPALGGQGMLQYLFQEGGIARMSTMIVRRDLLGNVRFDESLTKHQDWDFAVTLAGVCRIIYNPRGDVYVDHTASQRMSGRANPDATLRFLEKYRELMTPVTRNGFLLWSATSATLRQDKLAVDRILSKIAKPLRPTQWLKALVLKVVVRIPHFPRLIAGAYVLMVRVLRRK